MRGAAKPFFVGHPKRAGVASGVNVFPDVPFPALWRGHPDGSWPRVGKGISLTSPNHD